MNTQKFFALAVLYNLLALTVTAQNVPYLSGVFQTNQDYWTHTLSDSGKVGYLSYVNDKRMVYPDGEERKWSEVMPDVYGFQTSWGGVYIVYDGRIPVTVVLKGPISLYCRYCNVLIKGNCEPIDTNEAKVNKVCDFVEKRPRAFLGYGDPNRSGSAPMLSFQKGLDGEMIGYYKKKGLLKYIEDDPSVYEWYNNSDNVIDPKLYIEGYKRPKGKNYTVLRAVFVAILWYNIRNSEGYEDYQLIPDASTFNNDITIEELIRTIAALD